MVIIEMNPLLWILMSTISVSMISFIGILTLFIKEKLFERILLTFVSLSAGGLIGSAFLHLLPEAIEEFATFNTFFYTLIGFILFFFIEKFLHWRHCHVEKCPIHTLAYMNLLGDSIHNFIDGLIIAASFITNIPLGITATLAIILHEIPQEIGDFSVLVYAGLKKSKALFLNFIVAIVAIFGGIFGYFLSTYMESFIVFLIPFAAGGFIYIASSDLVPEIRKEVNLKKSSVSFGIFIIGILIMYML